MCSVLDVSRSGYYAWRRRSPCARYREDQRLLKQVRRLYYDSHEIYGAPRIHQLLAERGVCVGRKRIARLMRHAGLVAKAKRRFRRQGNYGHQYQAGFHRPEATSLTACHQVWVADTTLIKVGERFAYLAAVMDLHSRQIVGWRLGHRNGANLTGRALQTAIDTHRPAAGLVYHSDQGIEYANYAIAATLTRHGYEQSMSRRGNCYDNAHMESFFHTLKTECLHHRAFRCLEELQKELFQYIEAFYNTRRCHSSLGYLSPKEYATQHDKHR